MIFAALSEAAERGELILEDDCIVHYHLRRDGQLTIREIIVLPHQRRHGVGRAMVSRFFTRPEVRSILARCPADLPANDFYRALGFALEGTQHTASGRVINVWRRWVRT